MNDLYTANAIRDVATTGKPAYERPALRVMEQDEVLEAFQMTATEISAAGCWWNAC